MSPTHADLLARVEAATGPDRELDAALWLDFTPGATRRASTVKSSKGLWPDYTIDETREAGGALIVVPAYTASLDAALALVERVLPGWVWSVGNLASGGGQAYLMRAQSAALIGGKASTPALALLAAMLKALMAQESA